MDKWGIARQKRYKPIRFKKRDVSPGARMMKQSAEIKMIVMALIICRMGQGFK